MNPRGNGLRAWQASLTPAQRKAIASKGGYARKKALSPERRQEIASKAANVKAAMAKARKQALTEC